MTDKIDFLITWVDGNDPEWLRERRHYAELLHKEIDEYRFRDWDTLRYWFRGVEKFAPWVNNIYFVTCGHLPEWLNKNHPKIKIIKHSDFIPAEYLPTFSSNVFEFYFHKIPGLSEKFVYFNDDTFLIDYVKPEHFFRNNLPRDLGRMIISIHDGLFGTMVLLSKTLINNHFKKSEVIKKNFWKWFHPTYGIGLVFNLICSYIRKDEFVGFYNPHLQQAFIKETFNEVWANCKEDILRTSHNKFREYGDLAPWLLRYWQLASGNFSPYNIMRDGYYFRVSDSNYLKAADCIRKQKGKFICVNDTEGATNFDVYKSAIHAAFEELLPEKSKFEKK